MILCGLSRLSSEMAVRIVRHSGPSAKRGSVSRVSSLLPSVLPYAGPGSRAAALCRAGTLQFFLDIPRALDGVLKGREQEGHADTEQQRQQTRRLTRYGACSAWRAGGVPRRARRFSTARSRDRQWPTFRSAVFRKRS